MSPTLHLYLFIAIGGGAGACLRFFLSQLMLQWFGRGFPFGTLLVNVVGSFFLGLMFATLGQSEAEEFLWRSGVGVGFLGALTTFSTFSLDTLLLLQQGFYVKAALNMILNVLCCLLAAWLALHFFKG